MKLYTWQYGTLGRQRFTVVAATSVEEARTLALRHGQADSSEYSNDWQPGGVDFDALMEPPAYVGNIDGPLILDSYPQ